MINILTNFVSSFFLLQDIFSNSTFEKFGTEKQLQTKVRLASLTLGGVFV